jgi:hypothetical protein
MGNPGTTLQAQKERVINTLIERRSELVFNAENRCPVSDIGDAIHMPEIRIRAWF